MQAQDHRQGAITGPGGTFRNPDEIVRHAALDPAQKRGLLERWRDELSATAPVPGSEPHGLLERIGRALEFLDTESGTREQTYERALHGPGYGGKLA